MYRVAWQGTRLPATPGACWPATGVRLLCMGSAVHEQRVCTFDGDLGRQKITRGPAEATARAARTGSTWKSSGSRGSSTSMSSRWPVVSVPPKLERLDRRLAALSRRPPPQAPTLPADQVTSQLCVCIICLIGRVRLRPGHLGAMQAGDVLIWRKPSDWWPNIYTQPLWCAGGSGCQEVHACGHLRGCRRRGPGPAPCWRAARHWPLAVCPAPVVSLPHLATLTTRVQIAGFMQRADGARV
jgi:hypothetical protein